jgi:hypothetical protein
MREILKKINHVDCFQIERDEKALLILNSKQKKVFNPIFTAGVICFIASMVFKANNNADAASIPLGISTLILISGVWILSGTGKLVFDKTDGKIYCIYSHLGYLQKIYSYSLKAVDAVEMFNNKLMLHLDNGEKIFIFKKPIIDKTLTETLKTKLSAFILNEKIG